MTCRKCQAPCKESRRAWTNEGVTITYVHEDGREHQVKAQAIDGQRLIDEDAGIARDDRAQVRKYGW